MLIKSTIATEGIIRGPGLFTGDVQSAYHIGYVVRVHLIQVLIIDVGIGKIKSEGWEVNVPSNVILTAGYQCSPSFLSNPHTHPSTRSPMLSRWPRNVRQWYCWLLSISDVFWTHTSARVCCNTHTHREEYINVDSSQWNNITLVLFLQLVQTVISILMQHSDRGKRERTLSLQTSFPAPSKQTLLCVSVALAWIPHTGSGIM